MTTFILIISLLLLVSILLVKKTSYKEYGIDGILVGLIAIVIFMLYLLFK